MRKRICGFLDISQSSWSRSRNITHFDAAYIRSGLLLLLSSYLEEKKENKSVVVQKTNLFEPRKTEWVFIVCRRCLIIILSHLSAAASPLIKNNNGTSTTLTLKTYLLLPNFCYPSPLSNYRQCSKICKKSTILGSSCIVKPHLKWIQYFLKFL